MTNVFIIYDLTFLILFTLFVILFLYRRRKNLQRQGLLYLYRTKIGIKFIDLFTKKYSKILKSLEYIVVFSGYILMISVVWLLAKVAWFYLTSPVVAKALKVPVLIPLIPYLPDIFKIDFLPSFNFTYWIIIIALIAIPHEFAHGIFARLHKVKIHSTGFGFLGPFLAAFVEQDDKQMSKIKKFPQLSILAAGTFANVLTTIVFGIIFWLFFISFFVPAGVNFNAYATSAINISSIDKVNGISITDVSQIPPLLNGTYSEIIIDETLYFANSEALKTAIEKRIYGVQVFDNSPAYQSKLEGAITEINGEKITSYEKLNETIQKHSPGDKVTIKTFYQESVRENEIEERNYNITLGERDGRTFLGIGKIPPQTSGLMGLFYNLISNIKDPFIFYESKLGSFGWFIYYFLWWTVLICVSVAMVNMLPVGIFDGGRFFYLTVWGLTGSEKIGKKAFAASTWIILLMILAMMIKWALIFT